MSKALEHSTVGQFPNLPKQTGENHLEVRPAAWLGALAVIALFATVWFVGAASVPPVSAAADATGVLEVPYFPAQYVNQGTEPLPAPPTF